MFAIIGFCFLVFVFVVFALGKDDLIFLRKNIDVESLFHFSFLVGVCSLVAAALFGGRSLVGAVLGGLLAFTLMRRKSNIPLSRLFDTFATAASSSLAVGFLLMLLFRFFVKRSAFYPLGVLQAASYIGMFLFFLFFLLPLGRRGILKDGSIGLFFLLFFSCFTFVEYMLTRQSTFLFFTGIEDAIVLVMFVVALVLLAVREFDLRLWKNHK